MSKISRRGLRITAAAAGASVIAAAAWAATAQAGPADAATSASQRATLVTTRMQLSPMPQGTVAFGQGKKGDVDVTVNVSGLTPGSSHRVDLVNGSGKVITTFSPLTANSTGQARDETLGSGYTGTLASLHVAILNGNGEAPVTLLPIARTGDYNGGQRTYRLVPVEIAAGGGFWGGLQGRVVITYDRNARTISVMVNAKGLEPGAHAAHIHVGSCSVQGPVQYTLTDFIANAHGQIVNQTRVVTHVTTPLPARGWYFNLHQGNMHVIVANGRPTIYFRPLLCADI
jgi:Cu/Zn superoxide dismutase